jgi:hypothetical protein
MSIGIVLLILVPVLLLWYLLDWREKKRAAAGLPRHSLVRLFFATVAILTTLFSGGCGAIFLGSWISDGMRSNDYVGWEIISVLSGPPLIIGILIWWLSMRRAKG